MKETIKRNKNAIVYLGIVLVVFIGIAAIMLTGGSKAHLSIDVPEEQSVVFLNNSIHTTTSMPNQMIEVKSLEEGLNTVILSKDGYYPWLKEINIREGGLDIFELRPFMINRDPQIREVSEDDPEYLNTLNEIDNFSLPTNEEKLISSDGKVAVWIDDESVFAQWTGKEEDAPYYFCSRNEETGEGVCSDPIDVISLSYEITGIDFYQDRNDVLIFSISNGVYAIEINKLGTQNFQPIFNGINPEFRKVNPNLIHIKIDNRLLSLEI